MQIRDPTPSPAPCKICGANSYLFGVLDFNRTCREVDGLYLRPSGVPIYYRRCDDCGFLFSDAFDDWSDEDFKLHIYNRHYTSVDPEYESARPTHNAKVFLDAFAGWRNELDVLDFGGGNGCFAEELRKGGVRTAETYDRFDEVHCQRLNRKFNIVTSYETIEHMPDPRSGAAEMVSLLEEGESLLILSTLPQPDDILARRMGWWYAAPRNGHISLFSYSALVRLFGMFGMQVYPTPGPETHLICRKIPSFARLLMAGTVPRVA